MWFHQIAFGTYALTWFIDMIFCTMMFKNSWKYSFLLFSIFSCVRGVCCCFTNMIFLYLSKKFALESSFEGSFYSTSDRSSENRSTISANT